MITNIFTNNGNIGLYEKIRDNYDKNALYELLFCKSISSKTHYHGAGHASEAVCKNNYMKNKLIDMLIDEKNNLEDRLLAIFNIIFDRNSKESYYTTYEYKLLQKMLFVNWDILMNFIKSNNHKEYIIKQVSYVIDNKEDIIEDGICNEIQVQQLELNFYN
jgi:hypothetical protein